MTILLYVILAAAILSLAASCYVAFMVWKQNAYLDRIMRYGDGMADIQSTLKDMALEHHTLVEEMVTNQTTEILRHIAFVVRWQKVLVAMIKADIVPAEPPSTPKEQVKEAEALHGLGLEIAKEAFEDKEIAQAVVDDNKKSSEP